MRVIAGDTDEIARSSVTAGSRSVQIVGPAVVNMADQLIERARPIAAELLEAAEVDVVFDPAAGAFAVTGTPSRSVGWSAVAAAATSPIHIENSYAHTAPSYPYGTHAAVVEVDVETGKVVLQRLTAVDDAGAIVNPLLAKGQIHGGLASAIGHALTEEVRFDAAGTPLTTNFADYGVITAAELPSFEVISHVVATPLNPLGAKGVGESGTIGAAPAVQSAVIDALAHLGVRHLDIPLTPEKVWRAINHFPPQ